MISPEETLALYEADYENTVTLKFPPNKWVDLASSYYDDGANFFRSFTGLSPKYRVLGVEKEVRLNIGGYDTIGYIDLILENIETG